MIQVKQKSFQHEAVKFVVLINWKEGVSEVKQERAQHTEQQVPEVSRSV